MRTLQARLAAAERDVQAYKRENAALHRIASLALQDQPLRVVLHEIAREISAGTDVPCVTIELYDEARRQMEVVAAMGLPIPVDEAGLRVPIDQSRSGRVARSGQVIVETYDQSQAEQPDPAQRQSGVQTVVCVPLSVKERVIGTLTLAYSTAGAPDTHLVSLAYRLAGLVAALVWRRQAEEQNTASTQQLRTILDRIAGSVLLIDADGNFRFANQRAAASFGLRSDELIGKSLGDVFSPDVAQSYIQRNLRIIAAHGFIEYEKTFDLPGGSRTFFVSDQVLADPEGTSGLLLSSAIDITERVRAEAELKVALAKYHTLFDSFPLGITVSDATGQIVESNPMAERLLGIGHEEHSQRTIDGAEWRIVRPDGSLMPAEEYASVRALKEQRVVENVEMGIIKAGGVTTWINVTAAPLPIADYGVVITYGDISARKIDEEALQRSEQAFRNLYEHMRDAFVSVDMQGMIRQYNRSFQELLGYDDTELLQLTYRDITPEQWHAAEARIVQEEILPRGYSTVYEKEYRRKDGAIIPIELRTVLTYDAQGQPAGMWAIIRDITERRQAEKSILRRSAQLQQLAEAATRINAARDIAAVIHLVTSEARDLIGAHQAVTRMTSDAGVISTIRAVSSSEQYVIAHGDDRALDGTDLDMLVCRTNRPLRLAQADLEMHVAWKDFGAVSATHPPLHGWIAVPLVGRDGRNLGLIQLIDKVEGEFSADDEAMLVQLAQLTAIALENQQLLAEEQRARVAAEAAVRLREQFLSIASHELRTPLTSVLGYAQHFQRRAAHDGTLSDRDQRSLQQIITHAERLNRMIMTILDVSRIDQGRLQLEHAPLEITALVRETIMAIQGTAPHQFNVTTLDSPLWVDGDALRLEQVLHNVLGNAIKYSPRGGTVTVALMATANNVQLVVRDEGIGIPAADLPYIFERFYRAGNVSADTISGVGIGLFVVQEIVNLHGGTIAVESEEGVGSSFTITLPRIAVAL